MESTGLSSFYCFVATVFILHLFVIETASDVPQLPLIACKNWAKKLGDELYKLSSEATQIEEVKKLYKQHADVRPVDGEALLQEMAANMTSMMRQKEEAITKLVARAQEVAEGAAYDPLMNIQYFNAKKVNNYKSDGITLQDYSQQFDLEPNEHFDFIPVNLTMSTVHVPTDVYDRSAPVLNGVNWSLALDPIFQENYENDSTLTWQYFGSSTGFFRSYPGMAWQYTGVDMYDCRMRQWYIQAAASRKSIVILVDSSGSMLGMRTEIARATIDKIMDTLSDNDYFNIISFAKEPTYIDSCVNGTLIPANNENKRRMQEKVKEIVIENIANFDLALEEAFKLLNATSDDPDIGPHCNKAIMLLTDGAPENNKDVFEKYNWPTNKSVRVFTYLIGREVKDSRAVSWMACANRGYYTHISTLADVQENVQKYIHVLSRSLVIDRVNETIWTSVYLDAALPEKKSEWRPEKTTDWIREGPNGGLQLMTSVAKAVYDLKNETTNMGILLGVMGTDVPLRELKKLTPYYKTGVNGYSFVITNNGYILWHPDHRPKYSNGTKAKPNYNMVDLMDVEFPNDDSRMEVKIKSGSNGSGYNIKERHYPEDFEEHDDVRDYNNDLRAKMVAGESGNLTKKMKMHLDKMSRVVIRTNNYFFTPLNGTPFSLGIALPEKYGMYHVVYKKKFNIDDFNWNMLEQTNDVMIAPWNYCHLTTKEANNSLLEVFINYTLKWKNKEEDFFTRCNRDLVERFLQDVEATQGMRAVWMGPNGSTAMNSKDAGIELVFLGTSNGLTRYMKLQENLTDSYILSNVYRTIQDSYYKRAADAPEGTFVYSIRYNASDFKYDLNGSLINESSVVTGSSSVYLTGEDGRSRTIAATVGLQIQHEKFIEMMYNSSEECINTDLNDNQANSQGKIDYCNFSCYNESVNCLLLDNNGYIIVSKNENHTGKFLGLVDGPLMQRLIELHVYNITNVYDYQGVCSVEQTGKNNSASTLLNPIRRIFSSISYAFQEVALLLIQFNFYTWWNSPSTTSYGAPVYRKRSIPKNASLIAEIDPDSEDENVDKSPFSLPHVVISTPPNPKIETPAHTVTPSPDASNETVTMTSSDKSQTYTTEQRRTTRLPHTHPPRITYTATPAPTGQQPNIDDYDTESNYNDYQDSYGDYSLHDLEEEKPPIDQLCKKRVLSALLNLADDKAVIGEVSTCGASCNTKTFTANKVPNSNLLFVVVESICECDNWVPISNKPEDVVYDEDQLCERVKLKRFQRKERLCYNFAETEDDTKCGGAYKIKSSLQTLISVCIVYLITKVIIS